MMVGLATQVGNFMSMVTNGEWWKTQEMVLGHVVEINYHE